MVVTRNLYKLMLYVQYRVSEGLQPDENGYYKIKRADFIKDLPIAASTFDNNIEKLWEHMMSEWDIGIFFGLTGLYGEKLYVEVSYTKGVLSFKRNPITKHPKLQYLWARKPLYWETRDFRYEHVPVPEHFTLPLNKADFTDFNENQEG